MLELKKIEINLLRVGPILEKGLLLMERVAMQERPEKWSHWSGWCCTIEEIAKTTR